jgi:hypothetical protein
VQRDSARFHPYPPRHPDRTESILLSLSADGSVWTAIGEVFQMRVKLTQRFAKAARSDGRKLPIFYDDERGREQTLRMSAAGHDGPLAEIAEGPLLEPKWISGLYPTRGTSAVP